jgi:putative flippase GtrA
VSTHVAVTEPAPASGPLLRLIRDQRMAFLVVGGINTAIGLGWFIVVHELAGGRIGYLGSLVVAYALAILCAFFLHRRLVFRVRGHFWLDLARFTLVNVSSLLINLALLPVGVELLGLPVVPAQMGVMVVTVVLSYFAHLSFSFRREHAAPGYVGEPVED